MSKRDDVYDLLEQIQFGYNNIEGLVTRPGRFIDFTLKTKQHALTLARILKKSNRVKYVTAYAEDFIEVQVHYVPPLFPENPIPDYLQNNHGEISNSKRWRDKLNIDMGVRTFKMKREDLEKNPIPTHIWFGKYKFMVRYVGQIYTCSFCAEPGHNERDCQKKLEKLKIGKLRRIAPNSNNEHENIKENSSLNKEEYPQLPATSSNRKIIQHKSEFLNDNKNADVSRCKDKETTSREKDRKSKSSKSAPKKTDDVNSQSKMARDRKQQPNNDKAENCFEPDFSQTKSKSKVLENPSLTSFHLQENTDSIFDLTSDSQDESDKNEEKIYKNQHTNKRTRSDSSTELNKRKIKVINLKNSYNLKNSRQKLSSSEESFNEIFLECCKMTVQESEDTVAVCSCELKYFKCNCRKWNLIENGDYVSKCETCCNIFTLCPKCSNTNIAENDIIASCLNCNHPYDQDLSIYVL